MDFNNRAVLRVAVMDVNEARLELEGALPSSVAVQVKPQRRALHAALMKLTEIVRDLPDGSEVVAKPGGDE